MALDKIVIMDGEIHRTEKTYNNDVEYIRKDALLEVIVTAREAAVILKNLNNCPAEQEAIIGAYDYIKRKIESL